MESIGRRVRDARRRSLSERIEQCGCTAAEEEAAVLLREIVKAPQTQAGWSPIKEGVDVEAVKTELANGHTHDLICEELNKAYLKFAVRG
mgnify:CR=1 FL=1